MFSTPPRTRCGRRFASASLALAVAAVALLALAAPPRSFLAAQTGATPCASPAASPTAMGMSGMAMPTATMAMGGMVMGSASPAASLGACAVASPAPGTPVAAGGLIVTLLPGSDQAGPVTFTVRVSDAAGQPVGDATVTIRNRSLEMNHGVSTRIGTMVAPGEYRVEQVPMGMGGAWLVEVTVARPDGTKAVVQFIINLNGPKM